MTERTRDQLMPLQIGFIPLVDAAALLVAVDKGFAREEGLDVTLIREVSWSNVRDKLNLGLFDAAHPPRASAPSPSPADRADRPPPRP
jgi:ABC-type nitrate/sulfonate/bicarbonate transport system substrate-binding protein